MNLPKIERHNFIDGCYTYDGKRRHLEETERINLLRSQFQLTDIPILCIPELLEENIEKIKLWFQNGGRINQYSNIMPFKCGLSVVTLRDLIDEGYSCKVVEKKGVINKEGTEIIVCTDHFKDIAVLNDNLLRVQNVDGSYSLISTLNGKEVTPCRLYYIDVEYHDGLLVGLTSSPQPMQYGVPQTNEYIYFDENGNIALSSRKYASMGQFRNGLALVSEESCSSRWWRGFPIFGYGYTYKYQKYLIDKKGEVIKKLGDYFLVHEPKDRGDYLPYEPNDRIEGGGIFRADSYHHLNKYLSNDLKYDEQIKPISSLSSLEDTQDIRNLILNNYYNPEQELKRAIETVTYYTNHWAEITNEIDYNDDGTIKTTHRKTVPYIYYLNRDNLQLNKDYTPSKKKFLIK